MACRKRGLLGLDQVVYCTTIFPLCVIYSSTSPSPESRIASPKGGYYHPSSGSHRGGLPVSLWAILLLNTPSGRPMWGVSTHVSDSKRITTWTTALKMVPDVCAYDPSFTRILKICAHFFHAFHKLPTTASQSFFESINMQPSYLKALTAEVKTTSNKKLGNYEYPPSQNPGRNYCVFITHQCAH